MSAIINQARIAREQRRLSYLDGPRLKKAVLAATQCVAENQGELNRINVLPVADRDPGPNMVRTRKGVAGGLGAATTQTLSCIGPAVRAAALVEARSSAGG